MVSKADDDSMVLARAGNEIRRSTATLLVVLLGMLLSRAGSAEPVASFVPPLPEVYGPIRITSSSFPFQGTGLSGDASLRSDYVEEEYLISGDAQIYDWAFPDGVEVVETRPYVTRMLVRRPTRSSKFSGRIQLEMLNPSAGFDQQIVWAKLGDHFQRSGDVWVGVTIQPNPLFALRAFNGPQNAAGGGGGNGRYDALFEPPGIGTPIFNEQGQAWDIVAQLGRLLKTNTPANPLSSAHLRAKRMYLSGQSQTGAYTLTYINGFSQLQRMPGGAPIFDGYVPQAAGTPTRINELGRPGSQLPAGDARRWVVAPHDVPVIHVQTETEVAVGGTNPTYRRVDSDELLDRYRLYEVPGSSHADDDIFHDLGLRPGEGTFYTAVLQLRGLNFTPPGIPFPVDLFPVPIAPRDCDLTPIGSFVYPNPFPLRYVEAAAFENLDVWVTKGIAAPRADRVAVPSLSVRDENDNAIGGVRTSYLDVPTGSFHVRGVNGACGLAGSKSLFSEEQLQTRYQSRARYIFEVVWRTAQLTQGRWILPQDALQVMIDAIQSDVPTSAALP